MSGGVPYGKNGRRPKVGIRYPTTNYFSRGAESPPFIYL